MKYCWKCGQELKEGQLFCVNCGTKIENPEYGTMIADQVSDEYCSQCGQKLTLGSSYCEFCGTKVQDLKQYTTEQSAQNPRKEKKHIKFRFIGFGIIIALITVVTYIVYDMNQKNQLNYVKEKYSQYEQQFDKLKKDADMRGVQEICSEEKEKCETNLKELSIIIAGENLKRVDAEYQKIEDSLSNYQKSIDIQEKHQEEQGNNQYDECQKSYEILVNSAKGVSDNTIKNKQKEAKSALDELKNAVDEKDWGKIDNLKDKFSKAMDSFSKAVGDYSEKRKQEDESKQESEYLPDISNGTYINVGNAIYPDSMNKQCTADDIEEWADEHTGEYDDEDQYALEQKLKLVILAKNEMYARHGAKFKALGLKQFYFEYCSSWYKKDNLKNISATKMNLNGVENNNINSFKQAEEHYAALLDISVPSASAYTKEEYIEAWEFSYY